MDQQIGIGLLGGFIESPVTNQESRQLPMAHLSRSYDSFLWKNQTNNLYGVKKQI